MTRLSGEDVRRIARKTLSRRLDDTRPIDGTYLRALTVYLEEYNDSNFLIDLSDVGGSMTCLDCWDDVMCGIERAEFGDSFWTFGGLGPWLTHIKTPKHLENRGDRPDDIPGVLRYAAARTQSQRKGTGQLVAEPHIQNPKRVKERFECADGEVIEILSSGEEDTRGPSAPHPATNFHTHSTNQPLRAPKHEPMNLTFADVKPRIAPSNPTGGFTPRSPQEKHKKTRKAFDFGGGDVVEISESDEEGGLEVRLPIAGPSHYTSYKRKASPTLTTSRLTEFNTNAHIDKRVKYETDDAGWGIQSGSTAAGFVRNAAGAMFNAARQLVVPPAPQMDVKPNINQPRFIHSRAVDVKPNIGAMQYDAYGRNISVAEPAASVNMGGGFGVNPVPSPWGHLPPQLQPGYNPQAQLPVNPPLPGTYPLPDPVAARVAANIAGDYAMSGFQLNYDQEGPMHRIDFGGPDHEEKVKEWFMHALEDFDDMPTIRDAAARLGLASPEDTIPGMEVRLLPHQLIGVDWMVKQEKSKTKGGILADDMGLGKTVQTIAMMVLRPPERREKRPTLIVAPVALLEQWKEELETKAQEGYFRVRIHHGKTKIKSAKEAGSYDVVITSYTTLKADFPKPKDKKGKGKAKAKDQDFIEDDDAGDDDYSDSEDEDRKGPLAITEWHRVVLDEAQNIRNRSTRTAVVVALLHADYHWCLSGTPVTNTLVDLYSLCRFIGHRPFNDWKFFNEQIGKLQKKKPDVAGQRAQAMLKLILLRRTKQSEVEGRPILQLVPKEVEEVEIQFSSPERKIYDIIEKQQKMKMNKFIKAGTVMKNYSQILVMLLRLRQACNHPQLVTAGQGEAGKGDVVTAGDASDSESDDNELQNDPKSVLVRAMRDLGASFVHKIQAKTLERSRRRILQNDEGGEEDVDDCCPICFDVFSNNCCTTACGHFFCEECIDDVLKSALRQEDAINDAAIPAGSRPCPVCRQFINKKHIYPVAPFEPSDAELQRLVNPKYGKAESEIDDDTFGLDAKPEKLDQSDLDMLANMDLGDSFEPSVKMERMLAFIKQWHEETPDDKIIVYSQFTTFIDMLMKLLDRHNIEALRYDGRMSRANRDETISRFKKPNGPKIMLISLKCGGVGLNLVNANRIIMLDLAWNAATEAQAIDRAHRLGQMKKVVVKRVIIADTIEQRILKLQQAKQGLSDAALGEGGMPKMGRMNVNELKMLFGM